MKYCPNLKPGVPAKPANLSAGVSRDWDRHRELARSRFRLAAGPQLALADRIERFGRAMTATHLASVLAVSRIIIIYKLAKKSRTFRVGSCVRFDPKAIATWLRAQ
jgi:hypothetical protein